MVLFGIGLKRHYHSNNLSCLLHELKINKNKSVNNVIDYVSMSLSLLIWPSYEQSEWGWKEREKREEMKDERAWYLLACDADNAPVAFSHFRFDVECGDEVVYW